MADFILIWDDLATWEMLNDPGDLVGAMVLQLSEQAAAVARGVVHVLPGTPRSGIWTSRSNAVRPPGTTRRSIAIHGPLIGAHGITGGVNASADPTIFLEYPAEQMYERYPFLTTGLESLVL